MVNNISQIKQGRTAAVLPFLYTREDRTFFGSKNCDFRTFFPLKKCVFCTKKSNLKGVVVIKLSKGDVFDLRSQIEYVHNKLYPFSSEGVSVPVRVLEEYPRWYLCLVLPHKNPRGFGESIPYRITVPKYDITSGFVKISNVRREAAV